MGSQVGYLVAQVICKTLNYFNLLSALIAVRTLIDLRKLQKWNYRKKIVGHINSYSTYTNVIAPWPILTLTTYILLCVFDLELICIAIFL